MGPGETYKWSSDTLDPEQRLLAYEKEINKVHCQWSVTPFERDSFHARLESCDIDAFSFTHMFASPIAAIHDRQQVQSVDEHFFCLFYLERGDAIISQGANETRLKPNDTSIWDSSRPARMEIHSDIEQRAILIPPSIAMAFIPGIENLCATAICGNSASGRILRSHLFQLHSNIGRVDLTASGAMIQATLALTEASFRTGHDFRNRPMMMRALEIIQSQLEREDLSAGTLAQALGVSTRQLHRVFAAHGLTVGQVILRRRLLAGRSLLGMGNALSVTEVAMHCGFYDASHFSRSFKREFGESPTEFSQRLRLQCH